MYKLMFADDEPLIRNNVVKGIRWEESGFHLVGVYGNGRELLEAVESDIPDLVITDINMPYADGIEVAQKLHADYPRVKIVFLSGYNEFQYAKKAIEYGVKQYILKPVDSEDIYQILCKMKEELDQEVQRRDMDERMEQFYQDNRPLMKTVLLSQLLRGSLCINEIQMRVRMLDMEELQGKCFQMAVISIQSLPQELEKEREQKKLLVFEQLQELLEQQHLGFVILSREGCDVLLCSNNAREYARGEFERFLKQFHEWVKEHMDFVLTIGVGRICGTLEGVWTSYEDAQGALEYRDLVGMGKLIYLEDMETSRDKVHRLPEEVAERLIRMIKLGNYQGLEEEVQRYKRQLCRAGYEIEIIRLKMLDIVARVVEVVIQFELGAQDIFSQKIVLEIISLSDVDEIVEEVLKFCRIVTKCIISKRDRQYLRIVEKAKYIVNEQYMDSQFDIRDVCNALNLSESYFRTVFKKDTGISFGSYLRNVRMKEAKHLLMTTDLLNYQVAERVGYLDSGYFGHCFKKYYNISPSDMRKDGRKIEV